MGSAEQDYRARLERALEAEQEAATADARVSTARLGVFAAGVVAWALSSGQAAWAVAGVAPRRPE